MPIADRVPCLPLSVDAIGRGRIGSYRRWRAGPDAEDRVDLDCIRCADAGAAGRGILVRPRAQCRAFCRGNPGAGPDWRFRLPRNWARQHLARAWATMRERKRKNMARLAQQARRIESDPDEPWRALPSRLRRRLGRVQSTIPLPSRIATDLSFRAPPFLDRGRRECAIGGTSFQWTDRHTLALGIAGCPIRKRLQLATFLLS